MTSAAGQVGDSKSPCRTGCCLSSTTSYLEFAARPEEYDGQLEGEEHKAHQTELASTMFPAARIAHFECPGLSPLPNFITILEAFCQPVTRMKVGAKWDDADGCGATRIRWIVAQPKLRSALASLPIAESPVRPIVD